VRALLPRIRARARQVDADRQVPAETIRELMDAGLFGVIAPQSFGGSELGLAALVDVTVEIASVCGSSGWVYGVLAGHSWLLNLFPIEAQRDVFGRPGSLIATVFRFSGEVREVGGGYELTAGEGRFCSGIDHAQWVVIGNQVVRESGAPEPTFFVIPRSDISEIVDDWFVAGMRGTGSKTIRVARAFIPAHRAVRAADMAAGTSPGAQHHRRPIYRMPWRDIAPFSLIGVPIGIGRAAVAAFAESLRKPMAGFSPSRSPSSRRRLRDWASRPRTSTRPTLRSSKMPRGSIPPRRAPICRPNSVREFPGIGPMRRNARDRRSRVCSRRPVVRPPTTFPTCSAYGATPTRRPSTWRSRGIAR
jgi:hypothetical protein